MTDHHRLAMADFDFDLPDELIAQTPLPERDDSRLLVLERRRGALSHHRFRELPELLTPGDLLVVNDSRVLPARLMARKPSGGRVELLLLRLLDEGVWEALARPARRLSVGTELNVVARKDAHVSDGSAWISERLGEGLVRVRFDEAVEQHLERFGTAPLPPYIRRTLDDEGRYQTVFGTVPGSAAASTAGLHFTESLLAALERRAIRIARITLHVGLATFRPVTAGYADEHTIHGEWCSVGEEAAAAILQARTEGRRVVAVGTTVARTLETLGERVERGDSASFSATTDIYVLPGHRWRIVDALITNFHVPRSTLLLMVSAFATRQMVLDAYAEAIRNEYRFLSFGDAMLIV